MGLCSIFLSIPFAWAEEWAGITLDPLAEVTYFSDRKGEILLPQETGQGILALGPHFPERAGFSQSVFSRAFSPFPSFFTSRIFKVKVSRGFSSDPLRG